MPTGVIVFLVVAGIVWLIFNLILKASTEAEKEKIEEEIKRKYTTKYKIVKPEYAAKNELDLKSIKDKYNSLNFYYEDIINSPYFSSSFEKINVELNYDIELLFNSCLQKEDMTELIDYIEQYLSNNYISNQSINYLQLYVRGIILEYLSHRVWNINISKNIIKAFLCVYKNGKSDSFEKTNHEIKIMIATIIELLKKATNTPFVPGMKEPTEIINIVEMLINLYCIFPIDILEEYFDEVFCLLENKTLFNDEKEKVSTLSNFVEEVQANVFHFGYVDLRKFKAYPIEDYPNSKIDSISIDYINKTERIATISIDFIEKTPCDLKFYITYYNENKEHILSSQRIDDYARTVVPYQNTSFNKCGMVQIHDVIFGWPQNTKYIRVVLSEDIFYSIEYELP